MNQQQMQNRFLESNKLATFLKLRFVLTITAAMLLSFFLVALETNAQSLPGADSIQARYSKTEVRIPMRDGVTLHTAIYYPRDRTKKYPFMINRTPYSVRPYGQDQYTSRVGPSALMEAEGYIFVHQDVRGRWNSEGQYDNMRPNVDDDSQIDESSDTYDTIEWLIKNVADNNGKVGMWGISYPGFYCAAALPNHHPALVASTPQAPISDFYFDDFHHNGAYLLSYLTATNTFGYQHVGPTTQKWYAESTPSTSDAWSFYMNLGAMKNADGMFPPNNFFWEQLKSHPNYDTFWQRRSILPHLKNVKTTVMTGGGWFDAEDLYGPMNIYKSLEKNSPDTFNTLVMGPWSHGDWSRRNNDMYAVGKLGIGRGLNMFYQNEIEAPFFAHFLKGVGEAPKFEALVYDNGRKQWDKFEKWPPTEAKVVKHFLRAGKQLSTDGPAAGEEGYSEFLSDPANPVPYREMGDIEFRFTPRPFMSDDQRFASARNDVLTFQTEPLAAGVTVSGDILSHLKVSTTQSAADWIVKVIDVYPDDHPFVEGSQPGLNFGGFQQMIRSEVIRGRFRNSFEKPEPFVPNEVAEVNLTLQDIHHTFKPGHRIMVQIQSTWFPYIDRNPQKYVENVFNADREDYVSATHRVFHDAENPSWIEFKVMGAK
jgi:putative CocE/NonD family hydrolase